MELLEQAGLVGQSAEAPGSGRERFRGRLIFPIHDDRGRTVGFGGRILPDVERAMAAAGPACRQVPEHARDAAVPQADRPVRGGPRAERPARKAGWVAVVEGYTDVIAAHQVGLENVVGTLGTALGDDHLRACGGWPTASCWSSTGTRPGSRRRTGRWSCSWAASWISGC